jgi:hypothetical protein
MNVICQGGSVESVISITEFDGREGNTEGNLRKRLPNSEQQEEGIYTDERENQNPVRRENSSSTKTTYVIS